jgi:hypothetical protein
MSLLAILDFTLVMKYFGSVVWVCVVLSAATVWNFGFEWKMDGSAYNCLGSSELVVFLGDSFVTTVFVKGFCFKIMARWLSSQFLGLTRALFSCFGPVKNCLPFTSIIGPPCAYTFSLKVSLWLVPFLL